MTNADVIRRMTDEQLYEFLSEWECGDIDYSITFCDMCKESGNALNFDCDGCRKHWLTSDAVEYNGLLYWNKHLLKQFAPKSNAITQADKENENG